MLLIENSLTDFLKERGYTFAEEDGHIVVLLGGSKVNLENGDSPQISLLRNRFGYGSLQPDYCFNGLLFGDSLPKNLYYTHLSEGPEFLKMLSEIINDDDLLNDFTKNSRMYCYHLELPINEIIIDGNDKMDEEIIEYLIHNICFRPLCYIDGESISSDDDNPIIRVADESILPIKYIRDIQIINGNI